MLHATTTPPPFRLRLRWVARATAIALALLLLSAPAMAASEIVLVLDNSASMVVSSGVVGQPNTRVPASDPDRLASLATLILRASVDRDDSLTILNFQETPPFFRVVPSTKQAIQAAPYMSSTPFRGALTEAHRILSTSARPHRELIVVSDGAPTDLQSIEEARSLLGLDAGPPSFGILGLGLFRDSELAESQEVFFRGLLQDVGRYERVTEPRDLISKFTAAYAATLGSRPDSGTVGAGGSYAFEVGKYVSEVLVVTASTQRTGAYLATLEREGKAISAAEDDDNACPREVRYQENPRLCDPPFHHYVVWKAPNDPGEPSRWRLSLDGTARSPVAFGIILRYELGAELVGLPTSIRVGEPFQVRGRLTWRGKTFDAAPFFESDGFQAKVQIGDREVPARRNPDSTFEVDASADQPGAIPVKMIFENRWMRLETASPPLLVSGWLPLEIKVTPDPLDLGVWRGTWRSIRRCGTLSLQGSLNADRVPLEVAVQALPEGLALEIAGQPAEPGSTIEVPPAADALAVCAVTKRCCGTIDSSSAVVEIRGRDPHYRDQAAPVRLRLAVERTPWWRCWLPALAGVAALVLIFLVVRGFVSPHAFDFDASIRFSGKEALLNRARALPLRDMPGGKPGFYRDATVGLDAGGNSLNPRSKALLRLRAAAAGSVLAESAGALEKRNARTGKWEAVAEQDLREGLDRRVLYRVGSFFFRLE